ncbi:TetR family transcriptional regulator [Bradyrhizobium lupini HPC(L)]|uniref:TetR family transcriptional regulator n=1 Tax=Bradyrhizobium lupini HPC(L) TaxID=1229491 RepID=A0ABP2RNC5_RHILU|nr:TetR family transcriptional regulator [Bradyrhizobium lupini HPC(L)]
MTRPGLLEAAFTVIRTKGYAATTVDDVCAKAELSKGAFFHHFSSKEEMAVAAAQHWSEVTGAVFETASYHDAADPLERLLNYVAFRKQLIQGELPDFTCFVGTMAQEVYETSEAIRQACWNSISGHAETLVSDIEAALDQCRITETFTAESLALHIQAVIQAPSFWQKRAGIRSKPSKASTIFTAISGCCSARQ